jgi:hypothetical protein
MTSDQCLLHEMNSALDEFDAKKATLLRLILRLEKCLENLTDDAPDWKQAFLRQWAVLDEAQAFASHKGHKIMPEDEIPRIEKALIEMRRLTAERAAKRT